MKYFILSGKIEDFENDFYLMAMRTTFGQFTFESAFIDNTVECSEEHNIICRKILFSKPNCSQQSTFTNKNVFSIMLNENLKQEFRNTIAFQKAEMVSLIQRINFPQAYESVVETLWNSNSPCFDRRNKTSLTNGEASILRYCEWKGIPMSCSAIFTTVPTDQGLCCAFNMNAAEEIFVESTFRDMLETMQVSDKLASFLSSRLPTAYAKSGEPKTTPGVNFIKILLQGPFLYKSTLCSFLSL